MKTFSVKIHLEPRTMAGWSVWFPDLPGRVTWGTTQDEALSNMQEAVRGYIESLIARGLPIPSRVEVTDEPTVTIIVSAA